MWIFLMSVFVLCEVVMGEVNCDKDLTEQCSRPKLYDEIPNEVDAFKALCPQLTIYLQCSRDYYMNCEEKEDRMFEEPESYANLIALFNEICDEGSTLNEVVTSNLKCFNETFSNTTCPQEINAFMEFLVKDVTPEEFTTNQLLHGNVECMNMILLANCNVEDITRNCGIKAQDVTMQFIHTSALMEAACSSSSRQSLLQDINHFNLTEEQKAFANAELSRMAISEDI